MKDRMLRLKAICSLVSPGKTLVDVGTDHGFLPIELVKTQKVPRAIAMDVREGPLGAAKEHIEEAGLSDRIETRLSDGFSQLGPGEAQTAVISGLGGALMIKILSEKDPRSLGIEELVLGPQSEEKEVRRYLREASYRMTEERYIEEDGKFYCLMKVENGEEPELSAVEEMFGRVALLNRDEGLKSYLKKRTDILERVLSELPENEKGRQRSWEVLEELKLCACAEEMLEEEGENG